MMLEHNVFQKATIFECRMYMLITVGRIQVLDYMIEKWLRSGRECREIVVNLELEREALEAQLKQLESLNLDRMLEEDEIEKSTRQGLPNVV